MKNKKETENLKKYFSGEKLYGDNFNIKEIKKWYKDEEEGYSSLIDNSYVYEFHALNKKHGYRKIKNIKNFKRVLGFGSAYGEELLPIINKIGEVYIIEPSEKLRADNIKGKKIKYKKPQVSGKLDFPDDYFDLITCFGVLHHIPNVSFIMKEFSRVLKKGGIILMREPIVSMGDWRKKRFGLTKRERGIPLKLLRDMAKKNSLEIISEKKVLFPITRRINIGKIHSGDSDFFIFIDSMLSYIFSWNRTYHARNFFHKLRPQSVFYVLRKK